MNKILVFLVLFSFYANAQQDYTRNVVRKKNEVYLRGFKPQIQKGKTCAFYSTSMILAYYGKNVSPDKLKRKGKGSNPYSDRRKGSHFMAQRLKSLGFTFIIVQRKDKELFREIVKYAIDKGIPLRWSCNLRFSPIKKERNNSSHARIITGYIHKNNKITHVFYTDSWGFGHINKIMTFSCAFKMTNRFGPVFPEKNNQQFLADFKKIIAQYTKTEDISVPQASEEEIDDE